jgi:amino acid transporter
MGGHMSKRTQKIITWIALIAIVLGTVLSIIAPLL